MSSDPDSHSESPVDDGRGGPFHGANSFGGTASTASPALAAALPAAMFRDADVLSVVVFLALAAFAVFRLPYYFPTSAPVASEAYAVGCNNRIAVLAIVAIAGLFCLRNLFWRCAAAEPVEGLFDEKRLGKKVSIVGMPKSILFLAMAIHLGVALLIYACIPRLDAYGEPLSMLPRLEQSLHFHLQLYRDMDWAYGPGLAYFPQAFIAAGGWFGMPADRAYMLSYVALCAASTIMLFWIVDCLRLKVMYRVLLFSLFALCMCMCNITLGVNYTGLRFYSPYAAILLVHRLATRITSEQDGRSSLKIAGSCFLCALFVLSISIEMGIAYILAQCAYCTYRAIFSGRSWLYLIPATVIPLPLLLLCFPDCLHNALGFAKGGNNFPILPTAHIVGYAITLFWLLPILLRPCFLLQKKTGAAMSLAWAVLVVLTISPALGRCDPGHVLINGLGAFLMTMAVMAKYRPRLFPNYALAFFFLFGVVLTFFSWVNYESYLRPVQLALGGSPVHPDNAPSPLVDKLGLKEYASIAAPLGIDRATRKFLLDSGRFAPQCHPDFCAVFDQQELDRKIKGLDKADAVLVPSWVPHLRELSESDINASRLKNIGQSDAEQSMWLGTLFVYPIHFQTKRLPFDPQLAEASYISKNFKPLRQEGNWVLMVPDTGKLP